MKTDTIKEGFFVKGKDGKDIFVYCWDNVSHPKAVVQIFHGMAEHAARYKQFAQYLNGQGFIVYADDHRGHGKTAGTIEELGYIGEDGFNKIVEDEHTIKEYIVEKYKKIPIFVFGHSFGSFIAQEYSIRYGKEIEGVVLSGSAAKQGIEVVAGKIIASIERFVFGEKKRSKLLDYLSFHSYNKKIKNSKYKMEWLSADLEEVKKYEEDPFCGTIFTTGFFYYFVRGISLLYKKERLVKIPSNLPIFIIAGDGDPVGKYGILVKKLCKMYTDIGMIHVKMKLYSDGRHELLNEVNREEVFGDVLTWMNSILNKRFKLKRYIPKVGEKRYTYRVEKQ